MQTKFNNLEEMQMQMQFVQMCVSRLRLML